jgi:phosphoribosyl 1,2-cyclic phosphodiesterase
VKIISLQSGSNGNCIYVEAGEQRLLFDAGISGKRAAERLADHGRDIRDIHALLISHDHADHARCAGIYQRKFALPIHATKRTLRSADGKYALGKIDNVHHFRSGRTLKFGDVRVETIPTPHDGVDGSAFVVDDGRRRVGILTDLGHVFDELADVIASLDAVLIESNYDAEMLACGPYPWPLQQRIRGAGGHLSNAETAELLRSAGAKLKWACLGHISEDCNTHAHVLETHREVLGDGLTLHLAGRYEATAMFEL